MIIWTKINDNTIKASGYPIYIRHADNGRFKLISDWHREFKDIYDLFSAKYVAEAMILEIDQFDTCHVIH